MNPQHNQVTVKLGEKSVKIDTELSHLIKNLWKLGLKTSSCCQENAPGIVWIQFCRIRHALEFLDLIIKEVDRVIWDKDHCYDPDDDKFYFDDIGCVSIRFPRDDLKKVKKIISGKVK